MNSGRRLNCGREFSRMRSRKRNHRSFARLMLIADTGTDCRMRAQDFAGVRAAVERLFDGMRTADPELVRSVLAPNARFALLDERDGPAMVRAQAVDGWVNAIGTSGGSWDEQIYDVDVKVDGKLIYSKHQTGQFPKHGEIISQLSG